MNKKLMSLIRAFLAMPIGERHECRSPDDVWKAAGMPYGEAGRIQTPYIISELMREGKVSNDVINGLIANMYDTSDELQAI